MATKPYAFLIFTLLFFSFLVPHVLADSTVWYMRGDTQTVYTVNGYKLSETQSNLASSDTRTISGSTSTSYGVRIWILSSNGTTTELTNGAPIAVVTRTTSGTGIQSATWNCPGYSGIVEAVLIRVYQKFGSETNWTLRLTFVSDAPLLIELPQSTWTFYYYTTRSYIEGTTSEIYWGSTSYNTRVKLQYYMPNPWEKAYHLLTNGDFVGFILFPYVNLIGNLFYGVFLLIIGVSLYMRYENIVPVAIIFVLLGAAGGTLTMLVPTAGLQLAWLFLAFGLAILFYKLIKGREYGE